jgi:hypothetical protein
LHTPKFIHSHSSWLVVYAGITCLGHVITRGKLRAKAYDRDDRSVGIFESMAEAADALRAATP